MMDAVLLLCVVGVLLIAVVASAGAIATWLHARWRATR